MALSERTKSYIKQGLADGLSADELIAALDQASAEVSPQAAPAAQPAYTPGADLVGVDGTGSNAAPVAGTEARLDAADAQIQSLIAKVNALRAALIASGVLL